MAVGTSSSRKRSSSSSNKARAPDQPPTAKRKKSPGIHLVGGRIYDSENGISCHQCRQKTRDFTAACKACTIKFCHKCLLNRYGEKAEEVAKMEDWSCPRCRGVCNCSLCMKKKGHRPTGILVHTAKATGFSSVLDLLHHDAQNAPVEVVKDPHKEGPLTSKRPPSLQEDESCQKPTATDKIKRRKLAANKKLKLEGNANKDILGSELKVSREDDVLPNPKIKSQARPPKLKQPHLDYANKKNAEIIPELHAVNGADGRRPATPIKTLIPDDDAKASAQVCNPAKQIEYKRNHPLLPKGSPLAVVAGVELPGEDVGPALQFLEFCNAFSTVLGLNKGQAEAVLRELLRGRAGRRVASSLVVDFHIKLLSLIRKDAGQDISLSHSPSGGNSWLQALGKCINESQCPSDELFSDFSTSACFTYDSMNPSKKLRVLNVLCDETLSTKELRSWIDEENSKFAEKKKEISEKVIAAKKREKDLKQKLKDDVAKTVLSWRDGASLSVLEHDNLISEIRTRTEEAHAEMLKSISVLPKKTKKPDAVRTEPILLEGSRHAYWKLRSQCTNSNILLQDFGSRDSNVLKDKWFICDKEEETIIEKHISSIRFLIA